MYHNTIALALCTMIVLMSNTLRSYHCYVIIANSLNTFYLQYVILRIH